MDKIINGGYWDLSIDFNPNHDPDNGQFSSGGGSSGSSKWQYNGIKEKVDQLEEGLKRSRSANKVMSVATALRKQDDLISKEIERLENGTEDVPGDKNSLLTLRRRVRQLMKKAVI